MTSASANGVRRLAIECDDGVALRAELALPVGLPVRAGAVLCHPHPLHGGSMYSHIVGALFDGLPAVGVAALRFNFRGTSGSEGRHDGGRAEQLDVVAAIEAVVNLTTDDKGGSPVPVLLVGYSFGGDVALAVGHPRVGAWMAIAPPLRVVPSEMMAAATDSRPKHIVTGSDDEFRPPDDARRVTEEWPATRITTLANQNHFLATAGPDLVAIAQAEVSSLLETGD